MATQQIFSMTRDELEPMLTRSMIATVASLVKEGLLEKEKAEKYLSNHTAILMTKKTVIGKIWDHFFSKDEPAEGKETVIVTIVKVE